MKKAIVAATLGLYLLGAMAAMARASDFAFIKTSAPEALAGTFFAKDGSGSSAGGAVAIVTHKIIPSNNIISSIVTGWIPVDLGGSIGGGLGKASMDVGSCLNLLPAAKASLYGLVNTLSPNGAPGLKSALTASAGGDSNLFFIGPQFSWQFESFTRSHTDWVWFAGVHVAVN